MKEKDLKRELIINKICKKMGWNPKRLNSNQIIWIIKNSQYQNLT